MKYTANERCSNYVQQIHSRTKKVFIIVPLLIVIADVLIYISERGRAGEASFYATTLPISIVFVAAVLRRQVSFLKRASLVVSEISIENNGHLEISCISVPFFKRISCIENIKGATPEMTDTIIINLGDKVEHAAIKIPSVQHDVLFAIRDFFDEAQSLETDIRQTSVA